MADVKVVRASGLRRKASLNVTFCVKKERDVTYKKVSKILQKDEKDRTDDDLQMLASFPNVVKQVNSRLEKKRQLLEREAETEDCASVLEEKCRQLAEAIAAAQYFVVYSGAGVSTAASIPDYRGSNGIWTRLQQGKDIGQHNLTLAEPTTTHMALYSLYKKGILRHVVSQNCDGLHLRSGLPRKVLSEVHGNMYLEVCTKCNYVIWREFDVTQYTGRYAHKTARRCPECTEPLRDTIVHFGERGSLPWPINWAGACAAAKQADVILCIGSSLKVLKKYPWLWGMDKPVKKRPSLYIVNLQWTPKDYSASLKINGRCDIVMKLVMSYLGIGIPRYDRCLDPIFSHATKLHPLEEHTVAPTHQLLKAEPEEVEEKMDVVSSTSSVVVSEERLERIVCEIKAEAEADLWRPYAPSPSPPDTLVPSSNTHLSLDFFDKVYSELTKKILKGTAGLNYYNEMYGEPLDLSATGTIKDVQSASCSNHFEVKKEPDCKTEVEEEFRTAGIRVLRPGRPSPSNAITLPVLTPECQFCNEQLSSPVCQYYKRRETKIVSKGMVCYCCDSDDEETPGSSTDVTQTQNQVPTPTNPGWFGKGCRKRIKKKR